MLPSGSLVIAMDNDKQSIGTPFNLRAYGLAVQLLNSNIPLKWVISDTKGKDGPDFTASAARIAPTPLEAATLPFSGGPFVVHEAYAGLAGPIISAYGNNVAVYRLTQDTWVPVRYDLLFKPRPYVNLVNAQIATNALIAAGITTYTVGADYAVNDAPCYTIILEPHNADVSALPQIQTFLASGGNFYAQCESTVNFENAAATSTEKWLTDLGLVGSDEATPHAYLAPTRPFSQFTGPLTPAPGGSVQDWILAAQSSYRSGVELHIEQTPSTRWTAAVGDVYAGPGGNIFYLGGHDYSGTTIDEINGRRMMLNAIMTPATRAGECRIEPLRIPIPDLSITKTSPPSFTGSTGTYGIQVANVGLAATPDTLVVTDTLPSGLSFASGSGAGWSFAYDAPTRVLTARYPASLAPNGGSADFSITVNLSSEAAGSVTNRAWVAPQSEINTANNVSQVTTEVPTVFGRVFEDLNENGIQDADEIGLSGVTVAITSGGPTVYAVTDENGDWVAVGVTPGPATVDVDETTLPAGAYHTSAGVDPNSITALASGAVDAGVDGYAGLLTNLSVVKTAVATALAGDTLVYQIVTSNAGPAPARLVTVTDTLPATVTFLNASRGATLAGRVVTWPQADIAVGATMVDTVRVRAPDTLDTLVNVATARGVRVDPDLTDNRAQATTVLSQPNLTVLKTHAGDFGVGANGTYTITVANNGGGEARAPSTVTDTLPTGLTFVSAAGITGDWTFATAGQVTTATLASSVQSGGSASFSLTVSVDEAALPFVRNRAWVAGQREADLSNNVATDSAAVRAADLVVSKSSGDFTEGVNGVYTITVRNVGDGPTTAPVAVRDSLRQGLTFVSGAGLRGAWTVGASGQVVTALTNDVIAAGDSAQFTLTVLPGAAAVPSVENLAVVSGGGEVVLSNDTTALVITQVQGIPDLTVAKTSDSFIYGSNGTYTVTVTNVGGAETSGNVVVTDTLPAGVSFVSGTGSGWSIVPSGDGRIVTATYTGAALAAKGGSTSFTLTVSVFSTASGVVNTARVSGGGQTDLSNDSGSVTTPVAARPDLAITKTGPAGMLVGVDAEYTITVTNVGAAPTEGVVTVTDTLAATLEYRSRSNGTFSSTSRSGQLVTGTYTGTLAPGASIYFTIKVRPLAGAVPSVLNVARVSGGGDVYAGNDASSLVTSVAAAGSAPDLAMNKASSAFSAGQNDATYTITVSNVGGTTTSGTTTVVDTLPTGVSFASGSGTGWSVGAVQSGDRWIVTATSTQAVNPGAAFNALTLTVEMAASAPSSVTNVAHVSGEGETNTSNNSGSVTTAVQRGDLMVAKTASAFTYGSNATYTLSVSNAGPGASYGTVAVVDTLPAGLTYVSASGTGWTTQATQAPGGRWIITATTSQAVAAAGTFNDLVLTVHVGAAATVPLTNLVRVSGGNETNTTNNTGSVTTTVISGRDLAVTKTTSLALFTVGETAPYTITVDNVGTSKSRFTVVDTLPAGLVLTPGTQPAQAGWNSIVVTQAGSRYVVTASRTSDLNAGASLSFTLAPTVTPEAVPSALNRAWVSATDQYNTANDSSSVLTPVAAPDPALTKTTSGTFYVGGTSAYRLVVRNLGTAPTSGGITVTDLLPTGLTFLPGSSSGTGWAFASSGQTVTATYSGPALAPGDSTVFLLGVSVGAGTTSPLTNSATVSGGGNWDTSNDTGSVTHVVGSELDLTLVKTSEPTFTVGTRGTYTIQVNNTGTAGTTGSITVRDTLPAGLSFVAGSGSGAGWTVASADGSVVTATSSSAIASGASTTFTFQVDVLAAAVPEVSNRAWVSGGGQLNTSNDMSSVSTPVIGLPQMTLTKTVSPTGTALPGADLTYTIVFTNVGSGGAVDVIVTDSLPAQVMFKVGSASVSLPAGVTAQVEYSSDGGATWTYAPVSGGCGAPDAYDGCVRRVRWRLLDVLGPTAPGNLGTALLVAQIR